MKMNLYAIDVDGYYAHQDFVVAAYTWMDAVVMIHQAPHTYVTENDIKAKVHELLKENSRIEPIAEDVNMKEGIVWTSGYAE